MQIHTGHFPAICRFLKQALMIGSLALALPLHADEATIAVAANFTGPMQVLLPVFEQKTGHRLLVSYGSVGKFHAQINNGAPFEVLVSADEETPQRLESEGLAVPGTRFTYARGRLVLWSPRPGFVDPQGQVLARGEFAHLAISHPRQTVYGAAAADLLRRLGLDEQLAAKLIQGDTITQAYQFVQSGNAELGFVALSQVWQNGRIREGSAWIVPEKLSPPPRQDAVLLEKGRNNAAARAWLDFLRSRDAATIIESFGYSIPTPLEKQP